MSGVKNVKNILRYGQSYRDMCSKGDGIYMFIKLRKNMSGPEADASEEDEGEVDHGQ
jgi:hypothetical protein